jgi:rod shape-determining protein MreC
MPHGTFDRSPPPFFRQGPSAFSRLLFFASLSIFLMAADRHLALVRPLRVALATMLYPVQEALLTPVQGAETLGAFVDGITDARQAEQAARAALARQSQVALQVRPLEEENNRLRALLELRGRLTTPGHAAEVLYEAADPFTRKMVIDRGGAKGIVLGSPVINEAGVIGQVTRVYPATAEITLLTDRNASIPVLNVRTQQRSIAVGDPSTGGMELRFLAANADVQPGDQLETSGVDGVYPAGYPVAKVASVDRRADNTTFARIRLELMTRPDGIRQVLILDPTALKLPPRPVEPVASAPAGKRSRH